MNNIWNILRHLRYPPVESHGESFGEPRGLFCGNSADKSDQTICLVQAALAVFVYPGRRHSVLPRGRLGGKTLKAPAKVSASGK